MLKILIIECILSGVLGAVAFRLAWAFSHSGRIAWGVAIVIAAAFLIFSSGEIDPSFIRDFGGEPSDVPVLSPFLLKLMRGICLLTGAWLASLIVWWRKKRGLEDTPRFKDFP